MDIFKRYELKISLLHISTSFEQSLSRFWQNHVTLKFKLTHLQSYACFFSGFALLGTQVFKYSVDEVDTYPAPGNDRANKPVGTWKTVNQKKKV